jgi:hypothetical protein
MLELEQLQLWVYFHGAKRHCISNDLLQKKQCSSLYTLGCHARVQKEHNSFVTIEAPSHVASRSPRLQATLCVYSQVRYLLVQVCRHNGNAVFTQRQNLKSLVTRREGPQMFFPKNKTPGYYIWKRISQTGENVMKALGAHKVFLRVGMIGPQSSRQLVVSEPDRLASNPNLVKYPVHSSST